MMVGGRFAYMGAQGLALVALARLGSPEILGVYSLGLAVTAPVQQLFSLNLRHVLTTDVRGEHTWQTYRSLRDVTAILSVLVASLAAVLVGYTGDTLLAVLVLTLAKAVESQSDLVYGLMQRQDRYSWLALSMTLKGLAMLCGVTAGLLLTGSAPGAATGTLLGWLAVYLLVDAPRARRLAPPGEADAADAWTLARRALPLGLMIMFVALQTNAPRYFLERLHGPALLGYFSATAYVVTVMTAVTTTLSNALLPRLADRLHLQGGTGFDRLLRQQALLATLATLATTLAAIAAGDLFLGLLFGEDYAAWKWLLVGQTLVALAAGLTAIVANATVATRHFRALVGPSLLGVLVVGAAALWLVPDHGAYGAMGAALIGAVVVLVARALLLRRLRADGAVAAEVAVHVDGS
ncbi:MAG: hypothetical protein H6732_10320 [Alphaproteobacteria bacterium]|nr:hypothetical protein [Alphaproteobacteria bacterium]